jgi:Uma2 family endonuclease
MVQSVLEEIAAVAGHPSTKLTYADYMLFPDDGLRHEIIGGEHYVSPSPVPRHQRISLNLAHLIQTFLDAHPIGELFYAPIDVLLSEIDIVVPDLVFVSTSRSQIVTSKNLQGAPDLVVEILSPGTRSRDQRLKRDLYERAGAQEYWLVDPERDVVEVYRRAAETFALPIQYGSTEVVTTPLLPGLELPVDRIFR